MSDKKIGDRVKSTNSNTTPETMIRGTILEIDGREMPDGTMIAEWARVQQDDGKITWWSL